MRDPHDDLCRAGITCRKGAECPIRRAMDLGRKDAWGECESLIQHWLLEYRSDQNELPQAGDWADAAEAILNAVRARAVK